MGKVTNKQRVTDKTHIAEKEDSPTTEESSLLEEAESLLDEIDSLLEDQETLVQYKQRGGE